MVVDQIVKFNTLSGWREDLNEDVREASYVCVAFYK